MAFLMRYVALVRALDERRYVESLLKVVTVNEYGEILFFTRLSLSAHHCRRGRSEAKFFRPGNKRLSRFGCFTAHRSQ
jgi:hypothetical protein